MALVPYKVAISIVHTPLLLILWWGIVAPLSLPFNILSRIPGFILLINDFPRIITVLINTLFCKVVRTALAVLIKIELLCLRIVIASSIFFLGLLFWRLFFGAITWFIIYWVFIWLFDEGILVKFSRKSSSVWWSFVDGGGCLSHTLWAWHRLAIFWLLVFV